MSAEDWEVTTDSRIGASTAFSDGEAKLALTVNIAASIGVGESGEDVLKIVEGLSVPRSDCKRTIIEFPGSVEITNDSNRANWDVDNDFSVGGTVSGDCISVCAGGNIDVMATGSNVTLEAQGNIKVQHLGFRGQAYGEKVEVSHVEEHSKIHARVSTKINGTVRRKAVVEVNEGGTIEFGPAAIIAPSAKFYIGGEEISATDIKALSTGRTPG